jgi:hypothetical protein
MNPGRPLQIVLLFVLCFVVMQPVMSQTRRISGSVRDANSDEPVPFASVSFKNSTSGDLTDSSGHFSFRFDQWPSDTMVITCVGYQPITYVINKTRDSILVDLLMERGTFTEGVTVKVKVNKGLLLWRKIVQHKP